MSEVRWIKIAENIFDDEKIVLIESLPDGDAIIVIWFKLLCLAGKQNNGGVFLFNDRIPYTGEMLATIFRRPLNTVRLALKTFEEFEMIDIINDVVTIPNWDKYQKRDAIDAKRERDKLYQAKCRQKQKLLAAQGSSQIETEAEGAEDGASLPESSENRPDVRRLSDDLSCEGQTTVVTTDNKTRDIKTIDKKKNKREKKKTSTATAPEPFPAEHKAYKAAVFLDEKRRKRMPSLSPAEEPLLQKWAVCFNECHELDKHEWEEISRVLAFSQKNEFWSAKITDAYSFRRKYVNLLSEMPKSAMPRPEAPSRKTCSISELVEYPEGSGNWMPPWEAEERRGKGGPPPSPF